MTGRFTPSPRYPAGGSRRILRQHVAEQKKQRAKMIDAAGRELAADLPKPARHAVCHLCDRRRLCNPDRWCDRCCGRLVAAIVSVFQSSSWFRHGPLIWLTDTERLSA